MTRIVRSGSVRKGSHELILRRFPPMGVYETLFKFADVCGANSYSSHISAGFPGLVIRDTLITITR
jgi:hypothetical protein